ncbi:MAG: BT_3928 family protein [Cytophagales bacterium]
MKFFLLFCRIAVGCLFIFSGVIKLNDPVGTQIKMEEYFEVFGTHFMVPFALYVAVLMCVAEVALGFALLFYYRMKYTASLLLALILFFTFLTFYSAFFNKVTDCGCFGDFIKLTPWTSFTKDIVLTILILPLFIHRNHLSSGFDNAKGDRVVGVGTFLSLIFALNCIMHLSVWDFRAYKVGANIPQLMQPSCDAKYKYTMVKDGKEAYFDKYPADTTYQFKDMVLTNPDCMPKITDYSIWNDEGDYTKQSFEGKKLFIVILNTNLVNTDHIKEIKLLIQNLSHTDIVPMVITASDKASYETFSEKQGLSIPFYFVDGVVIKTMIRSNPGIMYLDKGTVKGKWHHNDVPVVEDLLKL